MEKIKIVYEIDWLLEMVYRESDKLLHVVSNTERFEHRCIKDLGAYLLLNKENKNNKKQLIRIINRHVKEAKEVYNKEEATKFSELQATDEEGEVLEFEPVDVLADVESEVIKKETIDLLAKGDRRKLKVLESWVDGNKNDKQISRTLASTFGGNPESHRKYIQRFRKDCRNILATAI